MHEDVARFWAEFCDAKRHVGAPFEVDYFGDTEELGNEAAVGRCFDLVVEYGQRYEERGASDVKTAAVS